MIYIALKKQQSLPENPQFQPKGIDSTLVLDCHMRQKVEVLFAKLDSGAAAPTQGSKSAAGWDLRALEDTSVMKGVSTKIRTGLAVAIPKNFEILQF